MAHHTLVRANLAAWGINTSVAPAEFWKLDENLFKSINGDDGGTWAPSAPIIIGGSGINITGAAAFASITCSGAAVFNGNATLGNASGDVLLVNATAGFNAEVDFSDETHFAALADFLAGLEATTATFHGVVLCEDDLVVQGDVTVDGSIGVLTTLVAGGFSAGPSSISISDPVTLSGDGHIRKRVVIGANANTTYNITSADEIYVPTGVLSTNRVYTLDDGTATGQKMRVTNRDGTNQITLKRADTTDIAVLKSNTGGFYHWIDVLWISGAWELSGWHYEP